MVRDNAPAVLADGAVAVVLDVIGGVSVVGGMPTLVVLVAGGMEP